MKYPGSNPEYFIAFKNALDEHKELDAKVRDYVRQNAERLHGQLEEMEQKR